MYKTIRVLIAEIPLPALDLLQMETYTIIHKHHYLKFMIQVGGQ
jgi:hypothetical protein